MTDELSIAQRFRKFAARPARDKYLRLALRVQRVFRKMPIPIRLEFGGWFLAGTSWVDHAILFGEIEKAEILFVERYLRAGMTVLDIGAHHGLYTLLASKQVGGAGRVVAFEPSPRERAQLLRNLNINFCSNVRVEACALGKERSQEELFLVNGGEDGCNSLRPPVVESGVSPVSVRVARLDDWLEKERIERVDFIKLDVEGGERDVLRGAAKLLAREPRPVIFAEVQDVRTGPWGYPAKVIIEHLVQRGYTWFAIEAEGLRDLDVSANTFDGNFVACPEERIAEMRAFAGRCAEA